MSLSTAFFTPVSTFSVSTRTDRFTRDGIWVPQIYSRFAERTSVLSCLVKVSCNKAGSEPTCVSADRRQLRSLPVSKFGSRFERRCLLRKRGYEGETWLRGRTKLCDYKLIGRSWQLRFSGRQDSLAEEQNKTGDKEQLVWPSRVEGIEAGNKVGNHEGIRWYPSYLFRLTGLGKLGKKPEEHGVDAAEIKFRVPKKAKSLFSSMASLFDLEKQFTFYGSYHSNNINILLHMIFVWPIYYSSLILYAYLPPLAPFPLPGGTLPLQQYMVLNWSFVIAAVYAVYYVMLDKKAGSIGAALCLGGWVASNAIAEVLPWSTAWKIVLLTNIVCWSGQIFGHQKFEGRAPALLDNIFQAFLMAPFFVLLEFLQTFGYEPYPGFKKSVEASVSESIRKFRASKKKKAT